MSTKKTKAERAEYLRAWAKANPEKIRAYNKKWMEKPGVSERQKACKVYWWAENKARTKTVNAAWATANVERKKAINKAWAGKNPDRVKATQVRSRAKHSERIYANSVSYRSRNSEKVKAALADWKGRNPHKNAEYCMKRKATKLQAVPAWAEPELIELIYAEAAHRGMVVDHIVPLQGRLVSGLHVHYNMQLLTATENGRKNNRFPYPPNVPFSGV
jgi:hypothetical protein